MKKEAKERRSAVRIDDYIPFKYELLTEDIYNNELKSFYNSSSGVEQIELKYPFFSWIQDRYIDMEGDISLVEQMVLDLLISINEKLDSLIKSIAKDKLPENQNLCFKQPRYVNISGAGIRFFSDSEIKKGACLKLYICVPLFPPFVISTLGKVVWVKKEEFKYKIGVKFTAIHQDDKDALIHYIFVKQRKIIKKSKEIHPTQ